MLTIEVLEQDGITILCLNGRLVSGPAVASLNKRVSQALADQKHRLLVDLSGVPFLDSSGIGELVASYTAMKKQGGTLKIVLPGPNAAEVLRLTRILTMIENYPDRQTACASFSAE